MISPHQPRKRGLEKDETRTRVLLLTPTTNATHTYVSASPFSLLVTGRLSEPRPLGSHAAPA